MTKTQLRKLMAIRNASLLLAVISITLLWASAAEAGTKITQTTCPVVITQPGEYSLATDVGPCAPGVDGIDILASGVTLHLNGHTVTGSAAPGTCNSSTGISVGLTSMPMVSGVGVLGKGTVSNFFVGFLAQNSANSFAKFVTVTAQCPSASGISEGFVVAAPGGGWTLQNNVVREPGISSSGIFVFGIDNNNLVGNDVNDSISIVDSSNDTIVHNTANDNFAGIFVGTFRSVSQNNQIHATTTNNNTSSFGLDLGVGATGNNITGNKSFGNDPFDMQDDNANCGGNKWEGNHFNTANQSCIK